MAVEASNKDVRRVEVFSAGCPVCRATIDELRDAIDPRHEFVVVDMHSEEAAQRAEALGIRTVPAVVVDGELLACCKNTGPTVAELQAAGLTRT